MLDQEINYFILWLRIDSESAAKDLADDDDIAEQDDIANHDDIAEQDDITDHDAEEVLETIAIKHSSFQLGSM